MKISNITQLLHACVGNSQNCCPEVPWTARCTIARGRKAEGNGASSCPRYRGAVVLSISPKQPWNQCFITQPMLKSPVFSPRNAILIGTRRQYTQRTSWRSTLFSLCLTSSTRQQANLLPAVFPFSLYGWRHKRGIVDSMDRLVTSY